MYAVFKSELIRFFNEMISYVDMFRPFGDLAWFTFKGLEYGFHIHLRDVALKVVYGFGFHCWGFASFTVGTDPSSGVESICKVVASVTIQVQFVRILR